MAASAKNGTLATSAQNVLGEKEAGDDVEPAVSDAPCAVLNGSMIASNTGGDQKMVHVIPE